MINRKGLAAAAACAALVCAGMVRGGTTPDAGLSLARPIYAADAPAKPLMNVLNQAGVGKSMSDAGLNAGGFIEGSWTYNFDNPDSHTNNGRVFDFEDQDPTLNQVDVFVEKTVDASKGKFDIGGRMEWIWGGDARLIHANGLFDHYGLGDGPDEQFDLNQLYIQLAVPVGSGLTVTAGKFVTLLGYEYINPTLNPFYSHSYLFGFAIPFTHTGIIGKYNVSDKLAITAGITRGWEQSLEDNNGCSIDVIWQVAYTLDDKTSISVTGITGPEEANDSDHYRTVIDGIITYKASDNLTLAANGDYGWEADAANDGGDAKWCGLALYAGYTIDSHFTLNGRVEYFNDEDGARGLDSTVYEATIGLAIKPMPNDQWGQGLIIRPELRWDHANHDLYNDGDENMYTFGADIIYAF
ncbi:MAG TPA: porin [Tepidisphaeraceae bacterium]|nr:porin [Tepidisphaeraceae bacterium]